MRRFNRRSGDASGANRTMYQHIGRGLAFGTGTGIVIGLMMDIPVIGVVGGSGLGALLGYAFGRLSTGNLR